MDDMKELNVNDLEDVSGGAGKVRAGGMKVRPDPRPGYIIHQISANDTLTRIAARYGTTIQAIMACNPTIKDKNLIRTGYYLFIPAK